MKFNTTQPTERQKKPFFICLFHTTGESLRTTTKPSERGEYVTERKQPRLINLKEVINRTSLKTTAIYALMKKGEFPQSIKITSDRVGWLESDIDEWINAKVEQSKGLNQ